MEDIVHLRDIVLRLLQDATVELPIADKDFAQQRMTDLIQELCEKLEDKTILLPLEGNVEVSEITLNLLKDRLPLGPLGDHPQLAAAVGIVARGVQAFRNSMQKRMPACVFKSVLNVDSLCKAGFVAPLTPSEDSAKSPRIPVDTGLQGLESRFDAKVEELKTLIKGSVDDTGQRRQRKRTRDNDSPPPEDIADERHGGDDRDEDKGDDEGGGPMAPPTTARPGRGAASARMRSSTSAASTDEQQSAGKRSRRH